MSLLKNLQPASHSPVTSRRAGLGFFCACVLSLTALACSPNDAGKVDDTSEVAAAPAASAPAADSASSGVVQSADSASIASESVSDTASVSAAPVAAPEAAKQPAPVERKAVAEAKPAPKPAAKPAAKPAPAKPAVTTPAASETAAAEPAAAEQEAPKPAATQTAAASSDSLLVTKEEYDGWKFFHVYCYRCHGTDAMGSDLAPNLRHSVGPQGGVTHDIFIQTVTKGRLEKGMPAWETLLDSAQIEHLYSYVKARSEGRLLPGRPHTKQ